MAEFNPFDPIDGSEPEAPVYTAPPRAPRPPKPPKKARAPKVELVGGNGGKGGFGGFLRRSWKILVPLAAVIVLLVVFSGSILSRLAPAWTVQRAAAKAADDMVSRLEESPWGAFKVLTAAIQDGRIGVDSDTEYSPLIHSYTLSSDLANLDFSLEAGGEECDVTLYLNPERFAIESSLLDDAYGITFSTLADDLYDSPLAEYWGLDDEDIDQMSVQLEMLNDLLDSDLDAEGIVDDLMGVYKDFLSDLDFTTESEKTRVSGERVSCTAISTSFDQRDVRDLVLAAYDVLTENESLQDMMLMDINNGELSEREARSRLEDQIKEARANLRESFEEAQVDVDLTYYLSGSRLVKVEMTGSAEMGSAMHLTLELGEDPSVDDWRLEMEVEDEYRMTADYTSETDGDEYSDRLTYTNVEYGNEFAIELSSVWDRDTGDLEITALSDGESFNVRCNLELESDSFRLTLNDQTFPEFGPNDSISIWAEEGASVGDPSYVNLDEWDENTLEDVMGAMAQMMGSSYDSGMDDMYYDYMYD